MIVAAVSTEFPMVLKDFPWCKKSAAGLPLQIYSHFDFFITILQDFLQLQGLVFPEHFVDQSSNYL